MADDLLAALGPVLTRWTMGAAAASIGPFADAELGADPGEAELRLLALSGHFLGTAVVAETSAGLRTLPDVPALALPPIPDPLRPLVRRLLQAKEGRRSDLLRFLVARGWTTHPADWMPAASDEEAPDVYAPWRDWADAAATGRAKAGGHGGLTLQNWDDFWPAARKAAFAELRRQDAPAARAMLQAKFPGEGADTRLRLMALVTIGLSDADAAFLEGVASGDRAPKVKALALSLLGRLGRGTAANADLAELADFLELRTKGLLRRTQIVAPRPLKTPAQHGRRQTLFAGADFAGLAQAFGMAPDMLAAAWTWGDDARADHAFATMAERSAADAIVADIAAILAGNPRHWPPLIAIAPRLAPDQRAQFAETLLRGGGALHEALAIAPGGARIDDVMGVPAAAALLIALTDAAARPGDHGAELMALGLLASQAGAQRALERLTRGGGLLQADPRLDMIRLNAALDDKGGRQ